MFKPILRAMSLVREHETLLYAFILSYEYCVYNEQSPTHSNRNICISHSKQQRVILLHVNVRGLISPYFHLAVFPSFHSPFAGCHTPYPSIHCLCSKGGVVGGANRVASRSWGLNATKRLCRTDKSNELGISSRQLDRPCWGPATSLTKSLPCHLRFSKLQGLHKEFRPGEMAQRTRQRLKGASHG